MSTDEWTVDGSEWDRLHPPCVQYSQPDFTESLQKLVEVEAEIQRQLGQPFNLTVREQQLALHYLQTAILCLQAATKAT